MQLKQLLSDDEGVSPVIGVILMVAITVILAAVIAAFVLGLGGSSSDTPQASFDFDFDEGSAGTPGDASMTITVESGDTLDAANLEISGAGVTGTFDTDNSPSGGSFFSDDVTAGDSVTLDGSDLTDTGGDVNVVWSSSDGGDSSILASFDVPNHN